MHLPDFWGGDHGEELIPTVVEHDAFGTPLAGKRPAQPRTVYVVELDAAKRLTRERLGNHNEIHSGDLENGTIGSYSTGLALVSRTVRVKTHVLHA